MFIETYGDRKNKAVILIHPMFTCKDFFADKLYAFNKYYLIIPTLSGHYDGSVYCSMQDEANSLDKFLRDNGIKEIEYIVGFSLGGNIAYNYFCTHSDIVKYAIIDSAPIFQFPKFIKQYFYKKYKKCLLKIKQPDMNVAKELNKCFSGMGEKQKYVAPTVDLRSLSGLIESCYNNPLYNINCGIQERLTFIYGTKDIARLCLPRIKKYKSANFVKAKNYNHCGFFMNDTTNYVKAFLDK